MNTQLFNDIADVIEKFPQLHRQESWSTDAEACGYSCSAKVKFINKKSKNLDGCGTKACIAGWAVHLTPKHKRPKDMSIREAGRQLLDISREEADFLFSELWDSENGRTVPQELRSMASRGSVFGTQHAKHGLANVGKKGTAIAGYLEIAISGDDGKSISREQGISISKRKGKATSSIFGISISGPEGESVSGGFGISIAGNDGKASAMEYGIIIISYYRQRIRHRAIGEIGKTLDAKGKKLVAGTMYRVNGRGKFVAVQ